MLLDSFDFPIQKFATSFAGRSAFFDHAMDALARYDTFKGVAMMAIFWGAWFYRKPSDAAGDRERRQEFLLIVFVGTIAAVVVARIMQRLLNVHQRPALANLGLNFPTFPDSVPLNNWNSFPSDHAMLFFALATGLWQINRKLGIFAFIWAFIVVSVPRIYLGYHYPSDLIGGAVLGTLSMLVFIRLPLYGISRRVMLWQKEHTGLFYCAAFLATEQLAHLFDDIRSMAGTFLQLLSGR